MSRLNPLVGVGLTIVLMVLAAPTAALGQSVGQRNEEIRKTARFHLGPIYLTPRLRVDGIGLDSNVHNSDENPEADFSFAFTPQVVSWIPFARRALITATFSSGYTYYNEFSGERSVSGALDVRGDLFLGRVTLFGGGGLGSTRDRPSHEIDERFRTESDSTFAGVDVRLSSRTSLDVSVFQTRLGYADSAVYLETPLSDAFNRDERGARATLSRRLSSLTSIGLRVEQRQFRFERVPLRNADSVMVAPVITLAPKALISGTAIVGIRQFRPVAGQLQGFSGVIANLSAGYQLRAATRFDVDWNRDIGYSYDDLQPYYVFNETGLRVRRHLFGRFDTIAGIRRTTYNYRTFDLVPVEDARQVRFNAVSLDAGYRLTRDARVGVGLTRFSRPASPSLRGYETYRLGLSFNYGY